MALRGITFEEAQVRASDDGALYNTLYTDGIIYGCKPRLSGYSLYVGEGLMLICGRLVAVDGEERISLYVPSSGSGKITVWLRVRTGVSTSASWTTTGDGSTYTPTQEDLNRTAKGTYNAKAFSVTYQSGETAGVTTELPDLARHAKLNQICRPLADCNELDYGIGLVNYGTANRPSFQGETVFTLRPMALIAFGTIQITTWGYYRTRPSLSDNWGGIWYYTPLNPGDRDEVKQLITENATEPARAAAVAEVKSYAAGQVKTYTNVAAYRPKGSPLPRALEDIIQNQIQPSSLPCIGTFNSDGAMGAFWGMKINNQYGSIIVQSYGAGVYLVTLIEGRVSSIKIG